MMAFPFLLSFLSFLCLWIRRGAVAQDVESDIKSIPLRTHSLQQVRRTHLRAPIHGNPSPLVNSTQV